MGRLAGRAAIVTGAASGIGRASAAAFVREGAQVLAVDLPERGLVDTAGSFGAAALEIDLTESDAPERITAAAQERFGRLDILFNNAGVSNRTFAAEMSDAEWDRVVSVNLRAVFRLCRAAIPLLIQSPAGRILNTASVMAEGTDLGLAAYCASKAGVAGLTRTLALELGRHGVTANYILPGAIRTGMTEPLWQAQPAIAEIWAKKAALKRLGEPEDIAKAAVFLASDDAGFVTGQGLAVDGGITLRI
jgi:NAD(P)-dependent dehydrogenase (short-subunit alcohol dehydrogenase family)